METKATVVWVQETPDGPHRHQHGLHFLRPEPALALLLTGQGFPAVPESPRHPVKFLEARGGTHRPKPGFRSYEVLIKFSQRARAALEPFLATHFADVNVTETKDPAVLLAYCRFYGDIQHLDEKLAEIRHSAMVVVGDPRGTFMEFFVSARGLGVSKGSLALSAGPLADVRPWKKWAAGVVVALSLAAGLMALRGDLPMIGKASEAPRPPRLEQPAVTVSPWNFYVYPQYHAQWLKVKAKYGLSDELMLVLFRGIKQTDGYAPGHSLADLTVYPQAIDRALGLLVLRNVGDADSLRRHLAWLESLDMHYTPLPDQGGREGGWSLTDISESFDRRVTFTFYKQLVAPSRADLAAALLSTLASGRSAKDNARS